MLPRVDAVIWCGERTDMNRTPGSTNGLHRFSIRDIVGNGELNTMNG